MTNLLSPWESPAFPGVPAGVGTRGVKLGIPAGVGTRGVKLEVLTRGIHPVLGTFRDIFP